MLRKVRSKATKTDSMLDFVMELNEMYNIKNVKVTDKVENKKLEREKRKVFNDKKFKENYFNEQTISKLSTLKKRNFKEDKENVNTKNQSKDSIRLPLLNNNKMITEFFKQKIPESKNYLNNHIDQIKNAKFISTSEINIKNQASNKGKFVEFFDDQNCRYRKLPSFEEKDLKFCKSKILPQVKLMTLDNDVLTEDEQIKDATAMLKDNLKDTIKLINAEGKEYLNKNLSRKLLVKKKSF